MAEHRCTDCGAALPANAPAGLCPRCLLQLGIGNHSLAASNIKDSRAGSSAHADAPGDETATHAGQAARHLASGILNELDATIGNVPRVLLRDGGDVDARVVKPGGESMPDLPGDGGRYQLLGEIARGGIGVVLKGRDVDLGRDLAVKVLLERHRNHPEMVRRFVEEAQIGGQLQHPGIVPVYEMGEFSDHRLYIAMKLVKGRTLAALLDDRSSPSDDRSRFLSIFEQVCQTMAYAHSRGVLHRDLKPSNIMVGSFGEVQVMDWGLAKVIEQGGVADEERAHRIWDDSNIIRTVRTGSDAGESRAGSVLGTPAYMAPEQARGMLDTLDERADVFSLGSILCEILTGIPAFSGRSVDELYRKAERAELADALERLENSGADADLITLARSCLASLPKDRPRDAGVVTAHLTAYLAGVERRLRMAELAQAKAEARATGERKRRLLTMSLAASILSLVLISWGGWAWTMRQSANRARATAIAVNEDLEEANQKRQKARAATDHNPSHWLEPLEVAKRAQARAIAGGGSPDLIARVQVVIDGITREREADEAAERERLSAEKDHRMVELLAQIDTDLGVHLNPELADDQYTDAFRNYGVDVEELDPEQAGKKLAASTVAVQIASALDQWSFLLRRPGPSRRKADNLVQIAIVADPDPWRNRLRTELSTRDPHHEDRDKAREILEGLAKTADPYSMPEASVLRLASALAWVESKEKAIALLKQTQRVHPRSFWVNCDLGRELLVGGQPEEASRYFSVGVSIRPDSPLATYMLAESLRASSRVDEAIAIFRDRVRRHPDDAENYVAIAALLLQAGKTEAARTALLDAKTIDPENVDVRRQIAEMYKQRGDWNLAIEELRQVVRLHPSDQHAQEDCGQMLLEAGRVDEAVAACREALRLDPRSPTAHSELAWAQIACGDFTGAYATIRNGHRPDRPGWHGPGPAGRSVRTEAEEMIALEPRLAAVIADGGRSTNGKDLPELARLCFRTRHFAAAADLWARAFASNPNLGREGGREARVQAAQAAARAATGAGREESRPDETTRERLRHQALLWLHAELADCNGLLSGTSSWERSRVASRLGRWQVDESLASVREAKSLTALPDAEAREWRAFWSEVETTKNRATTYVPLPRPVRRREPHSG